MSDYLSEGLFSFEKGKITIGLAASSWDFLRLEGKKGGIYHV
jgi:hypothetical protein